MLKNLLFHKIQNLIYKNIESLNCDDACCTKIHPVWVLNPLDVYRISLESACGNWLDIVLKRLPSVYTAYHNAHCVLRQKAHHDLQGASCRRTYPQLKLSQEHVKGRPLQSPLLEHLYRSISQQSQIWAPVWSVSYLHSKMWEHHLPCGKAWKWHQYSWSCFSAAKLGY